MSISSAAVSQFKSLIWYHLDHDLIENATFFAERLHAYATLDEETQYLLAKCLLRSKKYHSAYHVLRNPQTFSGKFLLAKCCISIEKLEEAERLLLSLLEDESVTYEKFNLDTIDHRNRFNGPDQSVVCFNLGLVYRKLERQADAERQFSKCLELNPFHWAAFENVCSIKKGTDIDINSVIDLNKAFQILNQETSKLEQGSVIPAGQTKPHIKGPTILKQRIPIPKAVSKNPLRSSTTTIRPSSQILSRSVSTESSLRKPTLQNPISLRTKQEANSNTVKKNPSISKNKSGTLPPNNVVGLRTRKIVTSVLANPSASPTKTRQTTELSKLMKSTAMNTHKGTDMLTAAQRTKRIRFEADKLLENVDIGKKVKVETIIPAEDDKRNRSSLTNFGKSQSMSQEIHDKRRGTEIIVKLLRQIGQSLLHLQSYSCAKALEAFSLLPTSQFNTGWVLARVGKAYFELARYKEAEEKFEQMRLLEPYRLSGLEIYATTLWHLRKEVNLSHLSHELMAMDRESPQSWFAIGNCYSLKQEHQSAIRCFKRAIQLDPTMAYGHTLCGHECIAVEEYDNAMIHFRSALRLDPNHYNAWYGMGIIALKTDKVPTAKYYFSKAVGINPTNNVLLCCVGTVLEKSGKLSEALRWYQAAQKSNPESPFPKLKIAKALMALGRCEEALPLFEHLKEVYPQEAGIRYMIGQALKKLGNTSDALMEFTKALDMDCKNTNIIRNAIDTLPLSEADIGTKHEDGMIKAF